MITVVESKAKKTRGGTHGTKTFMAKVTCLWSEITVNLLEQYVLSGKLVVRVAHQMYLKCTTTYGSLRAYWGVDLL